jgi:hypothetical protein
MAARFGGAAGVYLRSPPTRHACARRSRLALANKRVVYDLACRASPPSMRLQRAILANSDIGLILLNKNAAGDGYNRVGGIDAFSTSGG